MTFDLENPNPVPGDALRDEAANLLAARFGRPIREKLIAGKKVDLSFQKRAFGKNETMVVEAKDLAGNLGRDQAVQIWADYEPVLREAAPANLLLVTRRGLSSAAQTYVDSQPLMRHQTIWELENEMMGLTDYVRSLTDLFDREGLSHYYVPGRLRLAHYGPGEGVRTTASVDAVAFDTISAWLDGDDMRPLAVLGGYGAGKTSLAKRVVAWQAQRALKDPLARRPVLIHLGAVARYTGVEGLLGGMFTYDFPIEGFNVHHFLEMSDKGRLVTVLDGFDEMKHAMTWADFRSQIGSLNRLTNGRAKLLMLGRPSAFTSTEEHVHVLRGRKRHADGWRRLPDWPEFIEYDLEEFTPGERADFVRGYLRYRLSLVGPDRRKADAWIEDRAREVNQIADRDPEVFSKPVHAKILTDLAADPEVDLARFAQGVSRWQLYEVFFESLAERETEKDARRPIPEAARLMFLREVAFWLWSQRGGTTDFHAADLPDELLEELPGDADHDALKREYLTGSFLEKKSGDVFYFGHRSFAEFLVADRMRRVPPDGADQAVYASLFRDGVEVFLREAPDLSAVQAWADTLDHAAGTMTFEYLEFVASAFGGPRGLLARLDPAAPLSAVVAIFGDELEFSDAMAPRLLDALRTQPPATFFLLVCLLTFFAAQSRPLRWEPHYWAVQMAAILLERLFRDARVDVEAGKARIEPPAEIWKAVAARVVPELITSFGERELVFRGPQLIQQMSDRLRLHGLDLALQRPAARLSFGNEEHLAWSDVLEAMDREVAAKAAAYFRKRNNLSGVFSVTSRSLPPTARRPEPRRRAP